MNIPDLDKIKENIERTRQLVEAERERKSQEADSMITQEEIDAFNNRKSGSKNNE